MEKGHYCVSVTTTIPPPAFYHPLPASLQQRCGNGVAVFLQATAGELLPTFCKGSATLHHAEKVGWDLWFPFICGSSLFMALNFQHPWINEIQLHHFDSYSNLFTQGALPK